MAHDVFISHAEEDKEIADTVCSSLEGVGLKCWVAPRDVLPGSEWIKAIVDAIAGAKILVLVLSSWSNASEYVELEVQAARRKKCTILPFRIHDIEPTEQMQFIISSVQRLDATSPPLETHLQTLCTSVQRLLGMPVEHLPPPPPPPPRPSLDPSVRTKVIVALERIGIGNDWTNTSAVWRELHKELGGAELGELYQIVGEEDVIRQDVGRRRKALAFLREAAGTPDLQNRAREILNASRPGFASSDGGCIDFALRVVAATTLPSLEKYECLKSVLPTKALAGNVLMMLASCCLSGRKEECCQLIAESLPGLGGDGTRLVGAMRDLNCPTAVQILRAVQPRVIDEAAAASLTELMEDWEIDLAVIKGGRVPSGISYETVRELACMKNEFGRNQGWAQCKRRYVEWQGYLVDVDETGRARVFSDQREAASGTCSQDTAAIFLRFRPDQMRAVARLQGQQPILFRGRLVELKRHAGPNLTIDIDDVVLRELREPTMTGSGEQLVSSPTAASDALADLEALIARGAEREAQKQGELAERAQRERLSRIEGLHKGCRSAIEAGKLEKALQCADTILELDSGDDAASKAKLLLEKRVGGIVRHVGDSPVSWLCVSGDETHLAAGSGSGIHVFNLASWQKVFSVRTATSDMAASFVNDSTIVVPTLRHDRSIWAVEFLEGTESLVGAWPEEARSLCQAIFGDDGGAALVLGAKEVGSYQTSLKVYKSRAHLGENLLLEVPDVTSATVSADLLALRMRSGAVELWRKSGERLWAVDGSRKEDQEMVRILPDREVALDPRGTDLIARDLHTGKEKWRIPGAAGQHPAKFVAHVAGSRVLVAAGGNLLKVWDLGFPAPICVRSIELYMPLVGDSRRARYVVGLHALPDRKHYVVGLGAGPSIEVFSLPADLCGK
jgi:hypothetical protein